MNQKVLSGTNRSRSEVRFIRTEVAGSIGAGVLNRIWRYRKIYRRRAAVEKFDEIILQSSAGVSAAAKHLTDYEIGSVVIQNCYLRPAIADGCAGSVGEIYEEGFVRFDQRVAVYVHVEQISLLSCGNCLAR